MNRIAVLAVIALMGLSLGALYLGATRPFQEAVALTPILQETVTITKCAVGAGYYNEAYFLTALLAALAAFIVTCARMVGEQS